MSSGIKVKICGVRTAEAAMVAAESGADFIGLVFVEGVRRQLQPVDGQALVRSFRIRGHRRGKGGPKIVGLFRNQPAKWVNEVARTVDLDCVQLTGDEDDAYARKMWKPVFRQVRIRPETTREQLDSEVSGHLAAGRTVVLDRFDERVPGGGGRAFDWSVAEGVASKDGVLLAGGLNPDNVARAVEQLHPWGVDVSSGVETDGHKDPAKIAAFIEAARLA
jgi:phosphoribosylanthranilate isomerase